MSRLKRQRHQNLSEVSEDLQNLDRGKQDAFVFATRAPNSSDEGAVWVNQQSSSVIFYIRDKRSGTWRSVTLS